MKKPIATILMLHAAFSGAVLFAGAVLSASDLPLAMLRFASVQTRSVEEWKGPSRAP